MSRSISFGAFSLSTANSSSLARPYHHGDLRCALIGAALSLMTEEQDWTFSLREVARRAGVSHNAPYSHFPEKRDLLIAVAATGFESLRDRMRTAIRRTRTADKALLACAKAYIEFGAENPALYRLMFSPALAASKGGRPAEARTAGATAKVVLAEVILRGARSGLFAVSPDDAKDQAKIVFSAWATVHGMTMLLLDEFTETELTVDDLFKSVERIVLKGLIRRRV
jgi:AcrR family transcriptional regulator